MPIHEETGLEFALLVQQHPEPVGQPGQRRFGVIGGQLDRPFQPPPPLGDVTVQVPERSQRLRQPQADSRPVIAGRACRPFQRPAQGGAQVVMLGLQPVQRRQVPRAVQLRDGLLGDGGVMPGMPAPGLIRWSWPQGWWMSA